MDIRIHLPRFALRLNVRLEGQTLAFEARVGDVDLTGRLPLPAAGMEVSR